MPDKETLQEWLDKNNKAIIDKDELDDLRENSRMLDCLNRTGVESWVGYAAAIEMYENEVKNG